jgi:mRNA interferase MazF
MTNGNLSNGSFLKNFVDWFRLKRRLDSTEVKNIFINEGEIWWCHVGENVGIGISGKDDLYLRPVLIIRKFSNKTFMAIPLTLNEFTGKYFYKIELKNQVSWLCLHQARFMDSKRLFKRMETISRGKFKAILASFLDLYKKS